MRGLIWNQEWTNIKTSALAYDISRENFRSSVMDTVETMNKYTSQLKAIAREDHQREIQTMTFGLVVCRDTEDEAKRDFQHIVDMGDREGAMKEIERAFADGLTGSLPGLADRLEETPGQARFFPMFGSLCIHISTEFPLIYRRPSNQESLGRRESDRQLCLTFQTSSEPRPCSESFIFS